MKAIEKRFRAAFRKIFPTPHKHKKVEFFSDGVGVRGRSLDHLSEPRFEEAWRFAENGNIEAWRGAVPDIRWRAHTCIWAASHGLTLGGDFVECGVNAGLLSMTVCHYLGFADLDRIFWLYDTFEGIPAAMLQGAERSACDAINARLYSDCFDIAKRNFSSFPNARLVRGCLPESIGAEPSRIAYLSIDLNSETFERQTIEVLWPRMARGAIVVIDDYGFSGHRAQRAMWDDFATSQQRSVLALPTGQGLLVR